MKNKGLGIFLLLISLTAVIIIVRDFLSSRPDKRPANPYEYSVEDLKYADTSLIGYKEVKQIRVTAENLHAIAYNDKQIYLLADSLLTVIRLSGSLVMQKSFPDAPQCIHVTGGEKILIGFKNYLCIADSLGQILEKSSVHDEKSIFTAITRMDNFIYTADAGTRKVIIYDMQLKEKGEIEGISGSSVLHGFIVPSPYFDLAVNAEGELWVVNPGMHSLQHYAIDGSLIDYWEKASTDIDGFSGCCNPAHFTFLPDGNFVTSEKGLVWIKAYNPKGDLLSVVAPPDKFGESTKAPDLAADEDGNIMALDYDKKLVRIFKPKDRK